MSRELGSSLLGTPALTTEVRDSQQTTPGVIRWGCGVPQITAAEFRSLTYPGESFGLDTGLTWIHQLAHQEESPVARLVSQVLAPGALRPAFRHLPLWDADEAAVGKPVPFFRDWLAHNQPGDEWWQPVDFSGTVSQVTVPVHLLGGWRDIS